MLKSRSDEKHYIGWTKDLKSRFKAHKAGYVKSTRNRGELQLIYYEACLNKQDAIHREKFFKTGFGRRFLKIRLKEYIKVGSN